ncbi:MAG: hypothetical protein CM1200mP22_17640 [Dehalococcoidia bacterium]|nr:MAG: hypothetical protein CM1200mP22_17640 [Dehalococcoidia bacterium]
MDVQVRNLTRGNNFEVPSGAPEGTGDITGVAVGIGMPLMSTAPGTSVSRGEEQATVKTVATIINKVFTEMDFMSHRPGSDRLASRTLL